MKADARLTLLRQTGLDVDAWLSGAMGQVLEELEQERRLSEARKSNRESTTMVRAAPVSGLGQDGVRREVWEFICSWTAVWAEEALGVCAA